MKQKSGFIPIIVIGFIAVIAIALIAASFWYNTKKDEQDALANTAASLITDFDSCAAAGNPVMESYPRQCAAFGKTYTEEITNTNTGSNINATIDCRNFFDGCNSCSKDNQNTIICTERYCAPEEREPFRCLDDENGLANTNASLRQIITITYPQYQYANDFVVSENYLYVARGSEGLFIYNVSSPENPKLTGSFDPYPTESITRYYNVAVNGNIAALTSTEMSNGPLFIDITDKTHPIELSQYSQNSTATGALYGIAIENNYAYYLQENSGMKILDITDPKKPVSISSFGTKGKPTDIVVKNSIAYIADSRLNKEPGRLIIVDVSDPKNPIELSSTITGGKTESLSVDGNTVYIANSTDGGVKIYDVSDPKKPVAIGSAKDIVAEDVFAVNNKLFVATRSNSVSVFDVTNPKMPALLASDNHSDKTWKIVALQNYVFILDQIKGIRILKLKQ